MLAATPPELSLPAYLAITQRVFALYFAIMVTSEQLCQIWFDSLQWNQGMQMSLNE